MRRISITMTKCERCKKPIATMSQPLLGTNAEKARFDRICMDCATEEEKYEVLRIQGQAWIK